MSPFELNSWKLEKIVVLRKSHLGNESRSYLKSDLRKDECPLEISSWKVSFWVMHPRPYSLESQFFGVFGKSAVRKFVLETALKVNSCKRQPFLEINFLRKTAVVG